MYGFSLAAPDFTFPECMVLYSFSSFSYSSSGDVSTARSSNNVVSFVTTQNISPAGIYSLLIFYPYVSRCNNSKSDVSPYRYLQGQYISKGMNIRLHLKVLNKKWNRHRRVWWKFGCVSGEWSGSHFPPTKIPNCIFSITKKMMFVEFENKCVNNIANLHIYSRLHP